VLLLLSLCGGCVLLPLLLLLLLLLRLLHMIMRAFVCFWRWRALIESFACFEF
jgi:hypothetical protein